jgi:hypothetical protein
VLTRSRLNAPGQPGRSCPPEAPAQQVHAVPAARADLHGSCGWRARTLGKGAHQSAARWLLAAAFWSATPEARPYGTTASVPVRNRQNGRVVTRSRAARLLGGPEDRQRATFLDLLFDLVFVFALFRLSQGLLEHLNWSGAFHTLLLLLTVWVVWIQTAAVTGRYDPGRPAIQLLVIACMYGSFVLAVAVSEAFGARGLLFAVA